MAYEVDVLAVGEGERSADALAARYIDSEGNQTVIVIDGGTKESGQNLVDLIKNHYQTNRADYVVLTHPDADHASGLTEVIEQLEVGAILMHRPWEHANQVCDIIEKDLSAIGTERKLIKALRNAREIEQLALRKGIPIHEPFQGIATQDGMIHFLGPSKEYYQSLIAEIIDEATNPLSKWLALGQRALQKAVSTIKETWELGTLVDPGDDETSPTNNSSAIMLLNLDGKKILFTGDAGTPALNAAADYAESLGIPLSDLAFMQVPHHGSKHNVGPSVLKRIKGRLAYISAAANSDKHPSKKVCNELMRNGCTVHTTQGEHKYHFDGLPLRQGWSYATPLSFFEEVEE